MNIKNKNVHSPKSLPSWNGIQKIWTVFYQGMFCSQTQITQYIGNQTYRATTSECIQSNKQGIYLFRPENIWAYPEIAEIKRTISWGWSYRHMIVLWILGLRYIRFMPEPYYPNVYPALEDGSVVDYEVISSSCSLGQTTDIEAHKKKYDALLKQIPENIIMFGISRGAATTFSAIATYQYKNIKLCVLEGVPATISAQFKYYFTKPIGEFLYNSLITYLSIGHQHRPLKQYQAMAYCDNFPLNIPLVVITSCKDEIVTHKNSLNLAFKVAANRILAAKNGYVIAPVFLIQLERAKHNYYADVNLYKHDSLYYQNWLHRIYKELVLPYIEQFAQEAESQYDLKTIELTQGDLQEQVMYQAQFKLNKLDRPRIRQQAFQALTQKINQTTEPQAKQKIAKICSEISLYAKPLDRWSFFAKNKIQLEIQKISRDATSNRLAPQFG